jgi:hypothetical protein
MNPDYGGCISIQNIHNQSVRLHCATFRKTVSPYLSPGELQISKNISYSHINYVERLQTAKESWEKLHDDFHYFSHLLYVLLSSPRSVPRMVVVAWLPRRAQYTLIRRKNCEASAYWIKIARRWNIRSEDREQDVSFGVCATGSWHLNVFHEFLFLSVSHANRICEIVLSLGKNVLWYFGEFTRFQNPRIRQSLFLNGIIYVCTHVPPCYSRNGWMVFIRVRYLGVYPPEAGARWIWTFQFQKWDPSQWTPR